jgi:Ser/Thr protein kinase RdoA (MazF antagonist)
MPTRIAPALASDTPDPTRRIAAPRVAPPPPAGDRDALLRRADWRFLLPEPLVGRALCLDDGSLRASVALVAEQIADERGVAPGTCALAVARNVGVEPLRRARGSIAPGGAFYGEWDRASCGLTPGRVRALLAAAGFERVALYVPWPEPERAAAWIPLDDPDVARYYFRSHPRGGRHPLRRGLLAAGHARAWARLRLGRPRHLAAVAAVGAGTGAPLPGWLRAVRQTGRDAAIAADGGWLLVTDGPLVGARLRGFLFPRGEPRPASVAKLVRMPASAYRIEGEHAALTWLAGAAPSMRATVPRPLLLDPARAVSVESMVPGESLDTSLSPRRLARDVERATDWLASLAAATRDGVHEAPAETVMLPALDAVASRFGALLGEALLRETRAVLGACGPVAVVMEHGDFTPWNVLVAPDGALSVIDWENGRRRGLAGTDLVWYLGHAALSLAGALAAPDPGAHYRRWLRPDTTAGRVRAAALARYAAAVGLDAGALRALRVFTWLRSVRQELGNRALAGRPMTRDGVREGRFVQLWEAELGAP